MYIYLYVYNVYTYYMYTYTYIYICVPYKYTSLDYVDPIYPTPSGISSISGFHPQCRQVAHALLDRDSNQAVDFHEWRKVRARSWVA